MKTMKNNDEKEVEKYVKEYSDKLDDKEKSIAVIFAGGHGKRIKSETPKVLHKLWNIPSVERICRVARKGLNSLNQIIVVGIGATEVIKLLGKNKGACYVYQKQQRGTGHALQAAMSVVKKNFKGNIYVFPADAGLLDVQTIKNLQNNFEKANVQMLMLTGIYEGDAQNNYYGRVIRQPEGKIKGARPVLRVMERRDILQMPNNLPHKILYQGKTYSFSRQELLENNEFNGGMYAFKAKNLREFLARLKPNRISGEYYLPDIIDIYNEEGLSVGALPVKNSEVLLAFNNKSVLKQMETIVRKSHYEKLKNIIVIEDEQNFFLGEEVIKDILNLDKRYRSLDIIIGVNAFVSSHVKINRSVEIGRNTCLDGNIILEESVKIGEGAHISTYANQTLKIGKGTQIFPGSIVQGNVQLGENVVIESGVRITGSDEFPTRISDNCLIRGTTYIFGSLIEEGNWIEHSVIVRQRVQRIKKRSGQIQKIKYILPPPEGMDSIVALK